MVLVGPSGCGKSTLLRMIAGLEEVTAGAVRIGGADVTELAPRHRDIAMVFQSYALYPHMTVRENLGYGLKVRQRAEGRDPAARRGGRRRCSASTELLDRKPAQLSGGQRQRVAMGRAIVREPQAFLMDEPLSNLDAKLRVGMRASLAQLHAQLGVTTVYVTHDQTEAMTLGQRVAVMRDGRIVQVDEPQVLYDEPARPLRRRVHRLAGDEPRRGDGRGRRASRFGELRDPARSRSPAGARTSTASSSASGPRRSRTRRSPPGAPAHRRSRSRCSRSSAPTRTPSSASTRRGRRRDSARATTTTRRCSPSETTLFTARVDPRTGSAPARRRCSSPSIPARFHFFDPDDGAALPLARAERSSTPPA